mmetsp:Transcript_949/g.2281  ORF Transcript_949/g.2281 Transcript_949/m.2281 type:complete len:131 (-) Transcript_949:1409-1801(-)
MEDDRVRRAMETSDLPKLSSVWARGDSYANVAWKLARQQWSWAADFSLKDWVDDSNPSNPLISLYTYLFMVPVGGTFCAFGWLLLLRFHRRRVNVSNTMYRMNQHQKQHFLKTKLELQKPATLAYKAEDL